MSWKTQTARLTPWRNRSAAVFLVAAVILILTIFLIVRSLSSPSVGSVQQGNPNALSSQNQNLSSKYNGHYFSFTYPDGYHSVGTQKPKGNLLEVADYYSTQHLSRDMVISIQRESLSDETGYLLRLKQSNIYKLQSTSPGRYVFSKISNTESELVAYLNHGNMVASIAITSPGLQDIKSDFDTALNSFKWLR